MKLYVDDLRQPPDNTWVVVKTSREALELLECLKLSGTRIEVISLDHDLGGDDTTRPIMLWMCENDWWPGAMYIHTANPVGYQWLVEMANRYAHPCCLVIPFKSRGW